MQMPATPTQTMQLELADWRRQIFELYALIRASDDPDEAWHEWRRVRDRLFAEHPQTALDAEGLDGFTGLDYFPYDPELRVLADVVAVDEQETQIDTSTGSRVAAVHFADARFTLGDDECALPLYWLTGYAGGILLPFSDATSGRATYGGGRYLLDTVKGADLGEADGRMVLDFNFAYNPSCSYNPDWTCPLAPASSRLPTAVEAGERHQD